MAYETLGVVALARRRELKRRVRADGFKQLVQRTRRSRGVGSLSPLTACTERPAIVASSSCVKPAASRNAFN